VGDERHVAPIADLLGRVAVARLQGIGDGGRCERKVSRRIKERRLEGQDIRASRTRPLREQDNQLPIRQGPAYLGHCLD